MCTPREMCPECLRYVALRRHGELCEHRDRNGGLCPASGLTVAEAKREIARSVAEFRRHAMRRAVARE